MSNFKINVMKTIVIILACLILTITAIGQNESKDRVVSINEVEVTPPKFTGIENVANIVQGTETATIHQYVADNFKYPYKNGIWYEGTEVVRFTVTHSGELSNFNVLNSVSHKIDEEIILVLESTNGMWKPGYNNGKPVDMEKEFAMAIKIGVSEDQALMKDFKKIAKCDFKSGNKSFFAKGKPKKALKHYDHGIKLMPYDQALFYMRGLCRYELGDKEGARQDWERLVNLGGIDNSEYFAEDVKKLKGYHEVTEMLKTR